MNYAIDLLKQGKVIGFPTDTVWGIGCILSYECIKRLYRIKKGRKKPFILFIPNISWIEKLARKPGRKVYSLLENYWPGPLTVILRAKKTSPERLVSKEGGISFRIPYHPTVINLLKKIRMPLITTSANLPGKPPAKNKQDIKIDGVDYVLDGKSYKNIPSTILNLVAKPPILVRRGSIGLVELEYFLKRKIITKEKFRVLFVCTGNTCRSPMAEYLLRERLGKKVEVRSAGTFAVYGMPPSREAVEVMKEIGIDISSHISQPLTEELIEWADMIFVMEPSHRVDILAFNPSADTKVFFLKTFRRKNIPSLIPDPMGRDIRFYRYVRDIIMLSIKRVERYVASRVY